MTFPFRLTLDDIDLFQGDVVDASLVISFDDVFLERLQLARGVALINVPWMSEIALYLRDLDASVEVKFETFESVEIDPKQERFVVTAYTVTYECELFSTHSEPVTVHLDFDEIVASCTPPSFDLSGECIDELAV